MKPKTLREKAFSLRKQGYSYNLISEKTGIAKSTLSDWLSRIEFTPNKEVRDRIGSALTAAITAQRQRKIKSLKLAQESARKDLGPFTKRDLFMLGLGVYMGEGTKTNGITRIINADPKIIKLVIKWLEETFGLTRTNFRVRIHLYPDNNISKTLHYWSQQLNVPLDQFQKTYVDTRSGKKMFKRGKLPYGTAHVSAYGLGRSEHGVFLSRRINALIENALDKMRD